MARLARVVIPGIPHHVTQRGNRREQTFFNDGDYAEHDVSGAIGESRWSRAKTPEPRQEAQISRPAKMSIVSPAIGAADHAIEIDSGLASFVGLQFGQLHFVELGQRHQPGLPESLGSSLVQALAVLADQVAAFLGDLGQEDLVEAEDVLL